MDAQKPAGERVAEHFARHAKVYDLTRWALLLGRQRLARRVPLAAGDRVLDVGCGTGRLLPRLAERVGPGGRVVGVDFSEPMLNRAQRRCAGRGNVELHRIDWSRDSLPVGPFDAVLFSYSLAMIDDYAAALERGMWALRPRGYLAAVDFLAAPSAIARRMASWHVHLGAERRQWLRTRTRAGVDEEHRAWGGLWRWFLWIGAKPATPVATRITTPAGSPTG